MCSQASDNEFGTKTARWSTQKCQRHMLCMMPLVELCFLTASALSTDFARALAAGSFSTYNAAPSTTRPLVTATHTRSVVFQFSSTSTTFHGPTLAGIRQLTGWHKYICPDTRKHYMTAGHGDFLHSNSRTEQEASRRVVPASDCCMMPMMLSGNHRALVASIR